MSNDRKRILIVGGSGYLGSYFADLFVLHGFEVRVIDLGFFQSGVIYRPKSFCQSFRGAATVGIDDLDGVGTVICLAAISNDPMNRLDEKAVYNPSVEHTLAIAKLCKLMGVKFIFPSSCSVYGISSHICDEDAMVNPQTGYSRNKVEIERKLSELADDKFTPIALRLATVFGLSPRMRFDVVINMLCGMAVTTGRVVLNSDGQSWRPHVDIRDVAEAFRICVEKDFKGLSGLQVFNIGHKQNNLKVIDVASKIASTLSISEVEYLDQEQSSTSELVIDRKVSGGVDVRSYMVSFDKADRVLGFRAKFGVDEGILFLIDGLKRYRLNSARFSQLEFYRLQYLEHLLNTEQITLADL